MSQECFHECPGPQMFPKTVYNRPGLAHIDYRIGRYADIRASILHNLNKDPLLRDLTHRSSQDPGIALLEGAAILGDILTFYQDLYANEAYLRPARWRESIADLVRLIGYRLSPAVGGKTDFAFEVKGNDPVIIPAGFPVKAQLEGLDTPADFETTKEVKAYPALSKFNLYRPMVDGNFGSVVSEFSIETSILEDNGITLEERDRLMLIDAQSDPSSNAQVVIIKAIKEEFDRTNLTIEGTWEYGNGLDQISAYKLWRTFRHFGHNAPQYRVSSSDTSNLIPTKYERNLDAKTESSSNPGSDYSIRETSQQIVRMQNRYLYTENESSSEANGDYSFEANQIPLDVDVDDLITGGNIIVSIGEVSDRYFIRKIESFKSDSMTWGSLSGATTVVDLDRNLYYSGVAKADIRKLTIHEVISGELILGPVRRPDSNAGKRTLYFYNDGTGFDVFQGRTMVFTKEDGSIIETTATIEEGELSNTGVKRFRKVTLAKDLSGDFQLSEFPLTDKPIVTVYGNIVNATQGKTEKKAVLGNGDNREVFQTFKLPKAPLTYHLSLSETPPEVPELEIWVDDIKWTRVPSLFGRKKDEQVYIVREDSAGESWVQFGDGKTGTRLPSGLGNVVAVYRTGAGAIGALKKDTSVQAGDKLKELDKIHLPGEVSSGSGAESGENARQAAPGKVQSLGRLVGLKDFESEALAISGVSKARADWSLAGNIPKIRITILMELGSAKDAEEVGDILKGYNRCRGTSRYPLEVVAGNYKYVSLKVIYGLKPSFLKESVEQRIKEVIGLSGEEGDGIDGSNGLFGVNQRHLGQREYATRILGAVQNVDGVLWAELKEFRSSGRVRRLNRTFRLSYERMANPVCPFISCGPAEILSLVTENFSLSAADIISTEECGE